MLSINLIVDEGDNLLLEEEGLSTKMDDLNLLYESDNDSLFGVYSQHFGIYFVFKIFLSLLYWFYLNLNWFKAVYVYGNCNIGVTKPSYFLCENFDYY